MTKRRDNSDALDAAFDRLAEAAVGDREYPSGTLFVPDDSPYALLLTAARAVTGGAVALVRGDGATQLFTPASALGMEAEPATAGVANRFTVTESSGGFVRAVHPVVVE